MDRFVAEEGLTPIPPYEHEDVIAGQGTIGLEIVADWAEAQEILVPCGGGGLMAGISVAARALRPGIRVVGVEPAENPKLSAALAAGAPTRIAKPRSLADGLLTPSVGQIPFRYLGNAIAAVAGVTDDDLIRAVRFLHETSGLRVEPSGAATTAAVLSGRYRPAGPAVLVVSGGNIDPDLFDRLVH